MIIRINRPINRREAPNRHACQTQNQAKDNNMTQYEADKLRYCIKQAYDKLDKLGKYTANDYSNFKAIAHEALREGTLQDGLGRLSYYFDITPKEISAKINDIKRHLQSYYDPNAHNPD